MQAVCLEPVCLERCDRSGTANWVATRNRLVDAATLLNPELGEAAWDRISTAGALHCQEGSTEGPGADGCLSTISVGLEPPGQGERQGVRIMTGANTSWKSGSLNADHSEPEDSQPDDSEPEKDRLNTDHTIAADRAANSGEPPFGRLIPTFSSDQRAASTGPRPAGPYADCWLCRTAPD